MMLTIELVRDSCDYEECYLRLIFIIICSNRYYHCVGTFLSFV